MRFPNGMAVGVRRDGFGLPLRATCGLFMVCGMMVAASGTAEADLLSYEPFDYPVASAIIGQNGGGGWAGAWRVHTGGAVPAGSLVTGSGSLAGPSGLPTQGNHAIMTGEFGTVQAARDYANVAGAAGTRLYFSFIGQRLGTPGTGANEYPRGANVGLFDTTHPTRPERVGVGNSSNAATNAWSIIPEGSGSARAASTVPFSTLAWQVVRIDFLGDSTTPDNAYLFVNPDPAIEPDISTAAAQSIGAFDFTNTDFVRPFAGNTSGSTPYAVMIMDEIRLGTSYAAMSSTQVVPEPSLGLVAIVLVAAAAGAGRNRRADTAGPQS